MLHIRWACGCIMKLDPDPRNVPILSPFIITMNNEQKRLPFLTFPHCATLLTSLENLRFVCLFRKSQLSHDLWQFKVLRKKTWIQTQSLPLSRATLWSQLSAPLINLILDSLPPTQYDDSFKPSKRQHEVNGMPSHPQTDIFPAWRYQGLCT